MRPVAFVQARWNRELVDRCRDGFTTMMGELDPSRFVDVFEVSGSFELPVRAMRLARSGRFDAIVAAGLVANGSTYPYESAAHAVIGGLMEVQLETGVPVLSAVLTQQRFSDHDTHRRIFADHLFETGNAVARACVVTCDEVASLNA